ncbi:E3 ubiquitin-protein ligase XIAP-like [Ixodes scapularis]|uniref:E3 ubiquitin-protein ligase XIAP-like n=1 Tax=Ixodes scapularis TaxID=6945 RepID=UPI001A9FADE1|nr:E3 ubiquitin-protein ligase XIAP-like [Ixodes scapularis]
MAHLVTDPISKEVVRRFKTFAEWRLRTRATPRDFAYAGLEYCADRKHIYCRHCKFQVAEQDWETLTFHPMDLHRRMPCKFLEQYRDPRLNVAKVVSVLPSYSHPVYKRYVDENIRAKTFHDVRGPAFAKAGFFCSHDDEQGYLSREQIVTRIIVCFYCGVQVFSILDCEEDDPWLLHARRSPNCVFLRVNKTYYYVHDAVEKFYRSEMYWASHFPEIDDLVKDPKFRNRTMSTLYTANLTHPLNVSAMVSAIRSSKATPLGSHALFEPVNALPSFDHKAIGRWGNFVIDSAISDTHYSAIKSRDESTKRCIVCMKAPANIAYLPCGHCLSCFDCTILFKHCKACRLKIDFICRVYFA